MGSSELIDRAEAARAAGGHLKARAAYRDLVEWAASDLLGDGWGGSALVPYSFWRWTQYVRETESPDIREVDAMLASNQTLRQTRLVGGIFSRLGEYRAHDQRGFPVARPAVTGDLTMLQGLGHPGEHKRMCRTSWVALQETGC